MVRGLAASLLLDGAGLFQYKTAGRIRFQNVEGHVTWHCDKGTASALSPVPEVDGWFAAISTHTFVRRAAEDAVCALAAPYDSIFSTCTEGSNGCKKA